MIQLSDVSKIYNKNKSNEFQALTDINLKIDDGEMVAIIGKSGAGKTTLMHIIGCIDDFDAGEYVLDGIDVGHAGSNQKAQLRNEKIGIVIQDFALINDYTVRENIVLPLHFGRHIKGKNEKATAIMEQIGILDLKNKKASQLSGGQKQRVAIARAMINSPKVLLADEPTGALDEKTSGEIMGVLRELNRQGTTVIIITHDMELARSCDRIVEIRDGKNVL